MTDQGVEVLVQKSARPSANRSNLKMRRQSSALLQLKDAPEALQPALSEFDTDGDGTVSVAELFRAAELLQKERRKVRRMAVAGVTGLLFIFILALSNLATSYVALEQSKEMTMGSASKLISKNTDMPVATGNALTRYDLLLPSSVAARTGPSAAHAFEDLASVRMRFGRATLVLQASGHMWVNSSLMAVFLQVGQTLVISNGRAVLHHSILLPTTHAIAAAAETSDDSLLGGGRRLQFGEIAAPLIGAAADYLVGDGVADAVGGAVADAVSGAFADTGIDSVVEGASDAIGDAVGDKVGDEVKDAVKSGAEDLYNDVTGGSSSSSAGSSSYGGSFGGSSYGG